MEQESAYIARLWEHPRLCVAIFGAQFHTDEGRQNYEAAGISEELFASLEVARQEGLLLLNRVVMSDEGPLLLQYWKSYDDLDAWARKQPHSRWWKWLTDNAGHGVGFYHEIYQVRTAEAVYEAGTKPVGPALFSSLENVTGGQGLSRQRQQRFEEAR